MHNAAYSSVSAVGSNGPARPLHNINDAAAALTVTDAKRVGVATNRATGSINVSLVGNAGARRQLQRTITVNRPLDQRIVEEAGNVVPELGVPFAAGRGRVGLLLRRDGGLVERGVERLLVPCTTSVSSSSTPKWRLCLACIKPMRR